MRDSRNLFGLSSNSLTDRSNQPSGSVAFFFSSVGGLGFFF
jgi:hypothetical protein